jgi:hypothetical protein
MTSGSATSEAHTSLNDLAEICDLILADRAEVSQNKLYVMGGAIDAFVSTTTPPGIQFGIAIIVRVP